MNNFRLQKLVAAVFTPMREDGQLALERVGPIVDYLHRFGVGGIFVCGTTGEYASLTIEERQATAERYIEAAAGRLPVVVHVGHNSLAEARRAAQHAQDCGAQAISAAPPSFFRPTSVDVLIDCLEEITRGAPELPFYYYHIPRLTGVELDMVGLLRACENRLPTLAGIKFADLDLEEYRQCVEYGDGMYDILFGVDESLVSGLEMGCRGAIGSTYNFLTPAYLKIIFHFENGHLEEARLLQRRVRAMVKAIVSCRAVAGLKATMRLIGLECGPTRLPLLTVQTDEIEALRTKLEAIGFFDWAPTASGNGTGS